MRTIKRGILLFGFLWLAVGLYSALVLNNTDKIFPPAEAASGSVLKPATIGRSLISKYLVEGAAGFLDSYSEALLLLKEYENSSDTIFDIQTANLKVGSALKKLMDSRKFYTEAIYVAEKLEYLEYYRKKLVEFDYDAYITKERLNNFVANEVKGFLQISDVIGLYRQNVKRIESIIAVLEVVRDDLNNGIKSDITLYWDVLQKYSESALFGNYATLLSKEAFDE